MRKLLLFSLILCSFAERTLLAQCGVNGHLGPIGGGRVSCIYTIPSGTFVTLSGDATSTATGGATVVHGISGVPLCTGFTPTNGQVVTYTTAGSPNPCYTAVTVASGSGTVTSSGSPVIHQVPTFTTGTDIKGIAVPSADSLLYGTAASDAAFTVLPTTGTNGCSGTTDILQWNNSSHAFVCGTAPAALPPNGSASGDLAGSYPSPTVAPAAVTTLPSAATATVSRLYHFTAATVPRCLDAGDSGGTLKIWCVSDGTHYKTLVSSSNVASSQLTLGGLTSGGAGFTVNDVAGTSILYILPTTNGSANQVMYDTGAATCPTLESAPTSCHQLAWGLGVAQLPVLHGQCTEAWGGSGTSFAMTSGDDAISNNTCYNDSGATRTITAVKCRSDNAGNTTVLTPTFGTAGTGTAILTGTVTCGNSYAYSATGTINTAAWTTGTGIDPGMSTAGNATSIALLIEYTYQPY